MPGQAQRDSAHQDPAGAEHGSSPAARMGWALRLQQVFGIDVEHCEHCGGPLRVIASIEDERVIGRILGYLGEKADDLAGQREQA